MKYYIFVGLLSVAAAYPKIIHEEKQLESVGESGHHHQVEHEHEFAKSHQSIKFEHFHPVPVYIKEHGKPIEKGKHEQNLKLVHPKSEHHHGDGLVLEDERHHTDHHVAFHEHEHHIPHHEHEHHEHHEHHGFEGFGDGE